MVSSRLGLDRKKLSPSELVELAAAQQPKAWPILGRIPQLLEETGESGDSRARLLGAENEASRLVLAGMARGAFGRPQLPASTMAEAVAAAGCPIVSEAVVAVHWLLALADLARTAGLPLKQVYGQSVMAAVLMRELSEPFGIAPLTAYTAGMLHDSGMPFMAAIFREAYVSMDQEEGDGACLAEHKRFGIDHTQAGLVVLIHRGFPPFVCEAAAFHHGSLDRMPLAGRLAACAGRLASHPGDQDRTAAAAAMLGVPAGLVESAQRQASLAAQGVVQMLG